MSARRGRSGIAVGLAMLAFAAVTAKPQSGLADMISLTSSGGGVYDYGVEVDAGTSLTFNLDQTITLSGLAGVTGASVSSIPFAVKSFTSNTVTFVEINHFATFFSGPTSVTIGTLVVDSSVLTLGTVDFSMETSAGTITGTVQGPVGAVPEPASLTLLGTALLGLAGFGWRRRRAL